MNNCKRTFIGALCLLFGMGAAQVMAQSNKTSLISNPSFEIGIGDWNTLQMKKQTNTSFVHKDGSVYLEKWVGSGSRAGDAHAFQTIKSVPNGRYRLIVAAQNVQQNSSAKQTGAWIVANDSRVEINAAGDYTVEFTVIENQATIGFEAVGATGNYLSCDNFRLYLLDDDIAVLRTELQSRIDEAEELLEQRLALNTPSEGIDEFQQVIAAAKEELTSDTDANYSTMAFALKKASLTFRLANATGKVPVVSTHGFVARGSTMAFGRNTVSGVSTSELMEQGFCWSTHPEPTVLDNRTTKYYTQNGRIYAMENLTPSTVYYVRAYALTKNYAVGYGDVVKVITLPKGKVSWGYDNGADAEANVRINTAVGDAVYFLNQLTSINGLYANVHYGSGTPTADCSYGGWMRVGPNASYQRTGTILHELGHGIGVGTHEIWNGGSSPLRAGSGRGDWLGERATAVVRFLDNNSTSVMTGDGTHMWPYGINGANEDNDDVMLYMSNALIYQALGEDGLPPTGGFATPAYAFEQEDTIKYYIKSESEGHGLYTSYLVAENSKLIWKTMSSSDAVANDAAAWYVTFNPTNSYYQLRNAATGHYVVHGGTMATTLSDNANFHLMRSRVDVVVGKGSKKMNVRGYWMVNPQKSLTPPCLSAAADGKVVSTTFNLTDGAHVQRWVFLTEEETADFEEVANDVYKNELDGWIERVENFLDTPHTEDVEGVDAALENILDVLKEKQSQTLSTTEIAACVEMAKNGILEFLPNVTPSSAERPFDITYMLTNAAIDNESGWSDVPTFNYSCMEYYETAFDFNQTTENKLPKGVYQLRVQAFQRAGAAAAAYEAYVNNTGLVTAEAYLGTAEEKVVHIATEAQRTKLGGAESSVGKPVRYIPNDLLAASRYFKKGLYENVVTYQNRRVQTLTLGIRSESRGSMFWTVFDNFRLYYYGSMDKDDVESEVEGMVVPDANKSIWPCSVYSITGKCVRTNATSLDGLPAGLYIVGGKKMIVK